MRQLRQNLVVQFSVISLVIGAVVAVACVLVISSRIRAAAIGDLVQRTESDVSTYFLKEMTPADLEEPMTGERYDRFHEMVQRSMLGGRIARVKVWATDGTVIYSDNQEMVGKKFLDDEDLTKALQGETVAEIAKPGDPENEQERSLGTLVSVYTPIQFPGYWEPQGVFEVYQDYEPTAQLIQGMQRWLVLVGGVGFIFLYAGSVVIVWRGWRIIRRQEAELGRTYEALQESEELHRAVVENMAEAVAITRDAKRVFVNKAFLDIHGLKDVAQVLEKPMDGPIFPADRGMVVARHLARQRGEAVPSYYEYRVLRSDGEVRTVETLAVPLTYKGQPATLAVLRDVTDERRAERLLRENQERLSVAQKNAKIGNWDWNLTTGVLWWSEQNYELYGFDPQEVAPSFEAFMATVEPRDQELVKTALEEALRGGRPYNIDIHSVRADGTKFVVNAQAKVLYDDAGKPTGMIGTVQDITERKRMEEALLESEEMYRAVVENVADAVGINVDGKRVFVNKAFLDIHGFQDSSQAIGKPIEQFLHPEDKAMLVERRLARRRGEPVLTPAVYRIVRPDGEVRDVETQAVSLQHKGQQATLIVMRDITEGKRAVEALRESEELHRAVVENMAEGVAITRDAKRVFVNKAFLDIHGLQDASQVIGEPIDKFVSPESKEGMVARSLARQRGEPVSSSHERRILRPNGEVRIVQTQAVLIQYRGQPANLAVLRDVTEERRAGEALRESEELHRAVVENMTEAVSINRDAKRVFVNKAFLDIHGLQDPSQVIGEFVDRFILPEDKKGVVERSLARQRGEPVPFANEYRIRRTNGEVREIEARSVLLRYRGQPANMSVLRDVTERRWAEQALRRSNALLDAIAQIQSEFILEADRRRVFERLLSLSLSLTNSEYGFVGEVLHTPEGRPYLRTHAISNVAWNAPTQELYAKSLADGLEFRNLETLFGAVLVSGKPVIANDPSTHPSHGGVPEGHPPINAFLGLPLYVGERLVGEIGIANRPAGYDEELVEYLQPYLTSCANLINAYRNSQQHKQVEEALQESEELHRAVVENMAEAVAITRDAKRVFVNKAFLDIHGLRDASQVVGKPMENFIFPGDRESVVGRSLARQRGEPVSSFNEYRVVRPNGEVRTVRALAVSLQYKGQTSALAVLRDVTEERRTEEERVQYARELEKALHRLQETQQQLVQSEKLAAIGQLVSGVAHELNNPLTGVWGITELVLRRDLDETLREDVELVHSEAARAVRIVQNLLSFARARRPERSYGSINEALEKVLELRGYEMSVSGIDLEREMQPDLPDIWFDFHQMQQVFLNIVVNAEQAMTEAHGGGKLTVRTQRVDGSIQISFTDDGPGIPKENLGRIFDPFFTTKEVGKGTGLGLSICYGIVQEHGGRLLVESEVGKGATFTVEIPMTTGEVT